MTLFERASDFTINDGTFSVVAGSQNNNYHVQGNLLQLSDPKETRQVTAWDQYREIKTGDIQLKRKITETVVQRWDREGRRTWSNLDARRIIYTASVRGEDRGEEKEFLYIKYDGRDAVQAHRQDFETFSAVKDINYVQLLGYSSWNTLPSLVFYNALVPVSHVFERNGFSALLQTYFSYASLKHGIDPATLLRELWIEPRTGVLCKGPYVEDSSTTLYEVWLGATPELPNNNHPSLDLQTYSNTSLLFQYLIGILPVRNIILGIRRTNRLTPEWPNNQDAKLILSSLPGTIHHKTSRGVIARYPGDTEGWYYYPWKEYFRVLDAMRENTLVMDDRSVRFMLKPADIASLESFKLCYDLQPGRVWNSFADSWVSQAHGIFSQLGIEEGEWGEYSILDYFYLQFEREQDEEGLRIPTDIPPSTPIYLFIRPAPCPSDNENKWDGWLVGRLYYWSYDSAGKEEMSEGERRRLGLPSFETSIQVWHLWWDRDAYDAIEMVNHHQRFDPLSLKLAQSLNYQILKVVGGNKRFEELRDDNHRRKRSIFKKGIRWVKAKCSKQFRSHKAKASSARLLLPISS